MTKHIVVIDDSLTVRKIFATILGREGYEMTCFNNPTDAIKAVRAGHVIPDLLFVDIELPTINGYDAIKYIRAHPTGKSVPIVVVSRHAGMIECMKSRLAGAVKHLVKPVIAQDIIEITKQYAQ
jgi:CheY-like chemotaxis protein